MAADAISITEGSGKTVDTKTISSKDRQIVVLGDPTTAAGVAPVSATDGLTVKVNSIASGQSVTIADITTGTVIIKDNGGSITVDGTLTTVSNLTAGTVAISNQSGSNSVNIQDGGNSVTIDGSVTVADITTGTIAIKDNGGSITVDGTVNIGTFPDNEPFNMAQYGGSTVGAGNAIHIQKGTGAVLSVDDNASSLTIDGSVTVSDITTGSVRVQGGVVHDDVDSGNPIKVGGKSYNLDGTVPGTAVVEGDRANFISDLYGRQFVETAHPNYWSANESYTTANGSGNTLVINPGAGLKLYLTDVLISNGATAGTIKLVEALNTGTTTDKVGNLFLAANGGAVINFRTPIALTADKSLGVTSSLVTEHSVTVSGFTSA